MAIRRKQVLVKVSSRSGTFLGVWTNARFEGFSKELNAGPGECVIKLDKVFDYQGPDLTLGNDVEVFISDKETATTNAPGDAARTVYKGYISLIDREIVDGREGITVHLLGYYTLLATDILKNANQTTLYSEPTAGLTTASGSQAAADVGRMMRAVIDRYRAETDDPRINYRPEDIPNTSTTAEYRFEQKTYREALDDLRALAPAGFYYYVDELGFVKMKTKPSTPTHKFIFGRHFNNIRVGSSLEKVRNFFLIWNGEVGGSSIYKHYQNDASIETYGRRAEALNDYGIDATGASDARGAKLLDESKDPEVKITCTIVDNNESDSFGYDIESIQPGDTCSFYGFSSGVSEIFRDNMLITAVNYSLDKVEIVVELVKSGLLDTQNEQGRDIDDINTGGLLIPESYT